MDPLFDSGAYRLVKSVTYIRPKPIWKPLQGRLDALLVLQESQILVFSERWRSRTSMRIQQNHANTSRVTMASYRFTCEGIGAYFIRGDSLGDGCVHVTIETCDVFRFQTEFAFFSGSTSSSNRFGKATLYSCFLLAFPKSNLP